MIMLCNLFTEYGADRAGVDAGFAVGAGVLIDDMKVAAFTDRFDRTAVDTGSTIRTVFGNIMASHNEPPPV